jgi:LemA protein
MHRRSHMLDATVHKRDSAQTALLTIIIIAIIAVVLLGLAFVAFYIPGYNRAIRLEQAAQEAWGNVDAQLQRRFDLVDNLVETVKGYAAQEKGIFTSIAEARTRYFQAGRSDSIEGQIAASNELSTALSRLLLLQEAYPQLKANENFRDLQVALEGTENRIAVARTRYNQAVRELNSYAKSFVGSFFARRAGVEPKPYFETVEQARTAPKVDFSTAPPEERSHAPTRRRGPFFAADIRLADAMDYVPRQDAKPAKGECFTALSSWRPSRLGARHGTGAFCAFPDTSRERGS